MLAPMKDNIIKNVDVIRKFEFHSDYRLIICSIKFTPITQDTKVEFEKKKRLSTKLKKHRHLFDKIKWNSKCEGNWWNIEDINQIDRWLKVKIRKTTCEVEIKKFKRVERTRDRWENKKFDQKQG